MPITVGSLGGCVRSISVGRMSRVSSSALTVHEMNVLAQGMPSKAKLVRIAAVAAAGQARAIANGAYRYLKENPDRLAEVFRGEFPKELWEGLNKEIETNRTANSEKILAERVREALDIKG